MNLNVSDLTWKALYNNNFFTQKSLAKTIKPIHLIFPDRSPPKLFEISTVRQFGS